MFEKRVPIMLAPGSNRSLWPLSRTSTASEFVKTISDKTPFQTVLSLTSNAVDYRPAIVLTGEASRFLAAEQVRDCDGAVAALMLQEDGPAWTGLVAAVLHAVSLYGEETLLQIMACDRIAVADDGCAEQIALGLALANDRNLVLFAVAHAEEEDVEPILDQVPPDAARWDMLLVQAAVLLAEMRRHAPDLVAASEISLAKASKDLDFIRLASVAHAAEPARLYHLPVELQEIAVTVPRLPGWSDLQGWPSVWHSGEPDADGNVVHGHATLMNCRNSLVVSRNHHLALQGLEGIAVVAGEDAIYAGRLVEGSDPAALLQQLDLVPATRSLTQEHPTSLRPWGGYTSVLKGERFQVKKLFVQPGKRLSLQKHHHRSEHWICVKGSAEVTIGEQVTMLYENQSVYIAQGEVHRLGNPGKIMLELIEIQTGTYLGEDDIVRLQDEFGRQ